MHARTGRAVAYRAHPHPVQHERRIEVAPTRAPPLIGVPSPSPPRAGGGVYIPRTCRDYVGPPPRVYVRTCTIDLSHCPFPFPTPHRTQKEERKSRMGPCVGLPSSPHILPPPAPDPADKSAPPGTASRARLITTSHHPLALQLAISTTYRCHTDTFVLFLFLFFDTGSGLLPLPQPQSPALLGGALMCIFILLPHTAYGCPCAGCRARLNRHWNIQVGPRDLSAYESGLELVASFLPCTPRSAVCVCSGVVMRW